MTASRKAESRLLMLLRHAKSSWDDPRLDDHERPLDRRGREAGRLLAGHFQGQTAPDLVLCSSALRTRQTLEHLLPVFATAPRTAIEDRLYLATAATLRARIAEIPDSIASVLVIGHNPGLHELAADLARTAPKRERHRIGGKFPTGALASFRLDGRWRAIASAPVALAAYLTPGDLAAAFEDSD